MPRDDMDDIGDVSRKNIRKSFSRTRLVIFNGAQYKMGINFEKERDPGILDYKYSHFSIVGLFNMIRANLQSKS